MHSQTVRRQECQHLLESHRRRVVRKDDVSCTGSYVMLRTGRGRIEDRRVESRLILRHQAITAAEYKIVLTKDNVDWSLEKGRRRDDGAKSEELAEGLGLLVGDSDGEVF